MTDVLDTAVEAEPGERAVPGGNGSVLTDPEAPPLVLEAPEAEPPYDVEEETEPARRWWRRSSNRSLVQLALTVAVVGGCMVYVLANIHGELILQTNTPTGGDFGAHVWGPAFLRDHILPHWRLSGWAPDWYAGFPMYKFYMVMPGLLAVLLDVVLPYGVAMKIVSALGLVALPLCCWAFGKLANLPFPIPALFSIAATFFLFDWSFTIYGGNVASTMAGEFSFSIALCIALLYLGVLARGMQTGKGRATAAVLFALTVLCHLIVGIFVAVATLLMFVLWVDRKRTRYLLTMAPVAGLLTAFWTLPFLFGGAYMTDMTYERRPVGNAPNGQVDSYWQMLFPYTVWIDRTVFVLAAIGLVGCVIRGRKAGVFLGLVAVTFGVWACLWPQSHLWNARLLPFMYLARYLLAFIGIYEIAALAMRHVRLEYRDAAARVSDAGRRRFFGSRADGLAGATATWALGSITLVAVVLLSLVYGAIHFQRGLPFAKYGVHDGKTTYDWLFFRGTKASFVDDWARWNYSGYEDKSTYGQYHDLVQTMKQIGDEQGCGRALWEHQTGDDLSSYGTPMALMLLPFFTDGCIGSMEGLYFEASGTTPYHFLTAAAGSKQASNPVRRLDYQNDDVNLAVRYMQDLGVRYYMAFRPDVVAQANENPDLTALRQVGPWTIYQVADSEVVVPLQTNPVVVRDHDAGALPLHFGAKRDRWLELGTSWFQHPEDWAALPAADGPKDWQRISVQPITKQVDGKAVPEKTDDRQLARVQPAETIDTGTLAPVTVSDVVQGDDSISFSVDRVGVPVLVKVSYFPNWKASGAEGPYRVAPNFMVVVPTSNHVTLTYGTSPIEYLGYVLTLIGIAGVIVLWRKGPVLYTPAPAGPVVWQDGELRWHEEPPLTLPEPEPEKDITADNERFEVLADQVFGPTPSGEAPAVEVGPEHSAAVGREPSTEVGAARPEQLPPPSPLAGPAPGGNGFATPPAPGA